MKVFLAFLYFFGSILLPVGLLLLLAIIAPPRFLVDEEALRAMQGPPGSWRGILPQAQAKASFSYAGALAGISGKQGGGTIRVLLFEGEKGAREAFERYSEQAAQGSGVHQSKGPGYHAYGIDEKGIHGRVELVGRLILHAEGPDPGLLERMIVDSGVVRRNPKANWMSNMFSLAYLPYMIMGCLLYAGLQLRIWNRVGSWAAAVAAKPGVEPVSEAELRRRLLAINQEDVPFQVVEKRGGKLEATWRLADAKWAGIMSLNKVSELRVIQLRPCEERKVCRALDIGKSMRATADGLEMGFSLSGFFFRGIIFGQWEYEIQYGFTFRDGKLRFEKVYEYKFNHEELKRPIVEVITSSGWEYRPVLFISRILGG